MVARNFSFQEVPYSRLLQIPDEEREFLNLEELKPHQLADLGLSSSLPTTLNGSTKDEPNANCLSKSQANHSVNTDSEILGSGGGGGGGGGNGMGIGPPLQCQNPREIEQYTQIYFDLNSQQTANESCVNSMYGEMTQTRHHVNPNEISPQVNSVNNHEDETLIEQTHPYPNNSDEQLQELPQKHHTENLRKRKYSYNDGSDQEDDTGDDSKSVKTTESKKQNHSEIEKRRRDKMNTYITELSAMVPMCHAMSRKLDKLTVLRMAVQHLKTIRGAVHSYTEGYYKPAFLSDQELKLLILQAAEGFLFVVGCDRGRILYVSESVSEVLNYTQGDLLGQSWFDILHPKDVAKVKEQLSSSDLSPRERLIDAKTMLPVKNELPQGLSRLCPGARRSFFCRMKCKISTSTAQTTAMKEEIDTINNSTSCSKRKNKLNIDKKYCVIQCTGYLKSWAPAKIGLTEQENEVDGDSCNLSCLVAIGRIPPNVFAPTLTTSCNNYPNLRQIQFISRHAMDGKFLFVDQRATLVLGFLPQELLGTSMYEYYQNDDIAGLAESHKAALQSSEKVSTAVYRFRTKDNGFIQLQSEWKSFKNPWTKDVEYIVAKNSVILVNSNENVAYQTSTSSEKNSSTVPGNFDFFTQSNGKEIHKIINSHVEASKIGRQIAEEVLDYQRRTSDSSTESSPDPETGHVNRLENISSPDNSASALETNNETERIQPENTSRINGTVPILNNICNNFTSSSDNANDGDMNSIITNSIDQSPNQNTTTTDGNDEAAMAVIMSLLEADAGLGGPVDFTGLPWPLP